MSPQRIREEICAIGQRLYARGFAAGNEGNLSSRIADDEVICSPTLICKGFMRPDDLCCVDMQGRQTSGQRARTSEILMHLEIYRGDREAQAVVHCHPPHVTAFAMTREELPSGILPEMELLLGAVPRAPYATPGTMQMAESLRPFVGRASAVLLSNHGMVSWGPTVERAYWYTEILDAYCRMLMLARQIGSVQRLPAGEVKKLLALRPSFGAPPDPRLDGADAALFVNPDFAR